MEGGKPTIVTNAEGGRTTPSVVAYTKTGERLVGQARRTTPTQLPTSAAADQRLHMVAFTLFGAAAGVRRSPRLRAGATLAPAAILARGAAAAATTSSSCARVRLTLAALPSRLPSARAW
jgi:hypothetical protein